MAISEMMLVDYGKEAGLTRKMLERVPFENPEWKPHDKSMTIQRLASHIAEIPSWMMRIISADEFDFGSFRPERFFAKNQEELLRKFDELQAESVESLRMATDEKLLSNWTLRRGDQVLNSTQRMVAIRQWVFHHTIHHRGQLSVYLRLNQIPVPGMYGPSADER